MSEIFEALRKAQREADSRRSQPLGDGETASATPLSGAREPIEKTGSPAPLRVSTSRRGSRRFRWLRQAMGKNGHGRYESPVLISPRQETAIGEQFRILRTHVEVAGPGTYMITSALDQEGKTLCATNLAISLSMRMGAGVVLVDADLRRPCVSTCLGIQGDPGLVDCLLSDALWQDCIVPTAYERLSVLPAGRSSAIAPELLGCERMGTVISELKSCFPAHHIVVDAPPLLLTADPMVIARHMDHVLLVVRAGVTPSAAVLKAVETLGPQRLLGAILNDATETLSHHYYYKGRYPSLRNGKDSP
jgi:capsular exopolysaccharide synthesis family protein